MRRPAALLLAPVREPRRTAPSTSVWTLSALLLRCMRMRAAHDASIDVSSGSIANPRQRTAASARSCVDDGEEERTAETCLTCAARTMCISLSCTAMMPYGGSRCPRQESAREGCVALFAVGARVCAPIALLHRVAGGNACASLTRARARASSAETATRAVRFAPPHRAEDGQICQDRARRGTRALRPDSARELLQLHRPVWPCFDRE